MVLDVLHGHLRCQTLKLKVKSPNFRLHFTLHGIGCLTQFHAAVLWRVEWRGRYAPVTHPNS